MCVCVCVLLVSMDYNSPGSSVHGNLQARILEWVAIPSPGDLPNQGSNPGLRQCAIFLLRHKESSGYHSLMGKGNGTAYLKPPRLVAGRGAPDQAAFREVGGDQSQVLGLQDLPETVQKQPYGASLWLSGLPTQGRNWSLCNRRERSRAQLLKE